MKILIIGKDGQLGKSIHKILKLNDNFKKSFENFIFIGREDLDMNNMDRIHGYFKNKNFDLIINCAAYTAVDQAEHEVDFAKNINHFAVKQLAKIAYKKNAKLIHISTDFVFDGESDNPYTEIEKTNPLNIYGKTKLAGEKSIQKIMPTNAIILRTSWLYSEFGNNFFKKIISLGKDQTEISVVNDQIGSPTYASDLAFLILEILNNDEFRKKNPVTQIYHFSNKGQTSRYEFANEILKIASSNCKAISVETQKNSTIARRPRKVILDNTKIEKYLNLKNIFWKESLKKAYLLTKDI
ncbi:dTDP-4-dehydrorhamnose reductase [Methylophilales bacterium]|nr:dTDP-4-dehydrorhamnose reductase [Methylophilales bacterium]